VRCVDLDGEDYCLNVGFVDDAESPGLRADLVRQVLTAPSSNTGDMTLTQRLKQLAGMSDIDRANAEATELSAAAAAVNKAKALTAARAGASTTSMSETSAGEFVAMVEPPDSGGVGTWKILPADAARRQVKFYYCGPATLQMIDGADDGGYDTQASWASDLGTEAAGATWIGDMVAQINAKTSWPSKGGNYVIRNISGWDKEQYWSVVTAQLSSGAPYAEHPLLRNEWYPYLSTTGGYGGHFQVGRGWERASDGTRYIHIFEPYNEPDWSSYTTTTWGARRTTLAKVLAANLANQANIGI
jgi:hypothetical protein